ncbi:Eco47II family restriction endonuclease [Lactovum odontotermitis]
MYDLDFISEEDLINHVTETIRQYGDKLKPYDLKKFNSNLIDPIKLIFDKNVYQTTWEGIVANEIFRQRDKSNNNAIGYFHQNIFSYFSGCIVPREGWDVIFNDESGIDIDGNSVKKIYVEMKNKHNTMNSASAGKTYIKMQDQLLRDDDCACLLVEAIAAKSQNIKWETTIDKRKVSHKLIRRVSMDKFYEIVTGEKEAFYKLCMVLPGIVKTVVDNSTDLQVPQDSVFQELKAMSLKKDISIELSVYLLGFRTYEGFMS